MKKERTLVLSGFIDTHWDYWTKLKLVQHDGFKIDVVGRIQEAKESWNSSKVNISYHISDLELTKQQLTELSVLRYSGALTAEYEANEYAYSEYTHGTDYDTLFKVGNHDLYKTLLEKRGKYLHLEIEFI